MLAFHLSRLPKKSLANQVYNEQLANKWPGLVSETKVICRDLEMNEPHETEMTKKQYKAELILACRGKDEKDLKSAMGKLSKCGQIKGDAFRLQDYLRKNNLHFSREAFKIKTGMNQMRGNFKNKYLKEWEGGTLCIGCGQEKEVNSHLILCNAYQDLRVGQNMDSS